VATRRRILSRLGANQPGVLAFHFPFPGVGTVGGSAPSWEWQPREAD
jgi:hypothetical protein